MKSNYRAICMGLGACAVFGVVVCANGPAVGSSPSTAPERLRNGDIVFQDSSRYADGRAHSKQAPAIKKLTQSDWTHCGIVFIDDGKPAVYEAAGPVRRTSYETWANGGVSGIVRVKRLRGGLTDVQVADLKKEAGKYVGVEYDRRFEWGDGLLYCSEYVWKCFLRAPSIAKEVGTREKWKDFHWEEADEQTAKMLRERFPETDGRPPLEEPIITPKAIFESSVLEDVG